MCEVKVINYDSSRLEWDRFMRLSQTAQQITSLNLQEGTIILDVGGFDGSLALFLSPNVRVWVIDTATTGDSERT